MLLSLPAWALLTPVATEQATAVVDRIVAVVGERLILSSDVQLERTLAPLELSPVSSLLPASTDPLQVAIDRAIIRGLAGNAAIYVPSDGDVRARVASIRAHFSSDADWRAFLRDNGLSDERLASLLYSRLVVDRYILRNVQRTDGQSGRKAYESWISVHRARTPIRMVPVIESFEDGP